MKSTVLGIMITVFLSYAVGQTEVKHEGENFSLEAALEVFKKAKNLEEFEKAINQENNNVNNLDLNQDNQIDYVTVRDIKEGDAHAIVLSTYLDEDKKQDIAVIRIEKKGNAEAYLEIEGDESLYPANTIIEPIGTEQKNDKSSKGGPSNVLDVKFIRVNVWFWPTVRFVYAPGYVPWVSPYRWRVYPVWWRPWRPVAFAVFYPRIAPFRPFYRPLPARALVVSHRIYVPYRRVVVVHRGPRKMVIHNGRNKTVVVRKGPRRR